MRINQMNEHEKSMFFLMRSVLDPWIGGAENQMLDCEKESDEYQQAFTFLYRTPVSELKDMFYHSVMGSCKSEHSEHAKFAGKAFLEERIEKYINNNNLGLENNDNK